MKKTYRSLYDYEDVQLNKELKSWIYYKLKIFLSQDQYFVHINIPAFLLPIKKIIWESTQLSEVIEKLRTQNLDTKIEISRKSDPKALFEYPPFSVQILSMVKCWEQIKSLQKKSNENLDKAIEASLSLPPEDSDDRDWEYLDTGRHSFGNKPNLKIEVPIGKNTKKVELAGLQQNSAFPLSVDFRFEYNSFRRTVIKESDSILKRQKTDSQKDLLFIQTDIKRFFHNIELSSLLSDIKYTNKELSELHSILKLMQELGFSTLPIGWILSRFFANYVIQKFHILIQENLQKNIRASTGPKLITQGRIPPDGFLKEINFHKMVSYVDDIVFLLSVPLNYTFQNEVANVLITEAENLLSQVLVGNKKIEIHKDGSKVKVFRITKGNLTALKSNFIYLKTGDGYFDEDLDLKVRVSDLMMPADNEIVLNEVGYFREYLLGFREILLQENYKNEDSIKESLSLIKIKAEGEGGKYIRSIFSLVSLILRKQELSKIHDYIFKNYIPDLLKSFFNSKRDFPEYLKVLSSLSSLIDLSPQNIEEHIYSVLSEAEKKFKNDASDNLAYLKLVYLNIIYKNSSYLKIKKKGLGKFQINSGTTFSQASAQLEQEIRIIQDHKTEIPNDFLVSSDFIISLRIKLSHDKRRLAEDLICKSISAKNSEFNILNFVGALGVDAIEVNSISNLLGGKSACLKLIEHVKHNLTEIESIIHLPEQLKVKKLLDEYKTENLSFFKLYRFALLRAGSLEEFFDLLLSLWVPLDGRSFYRWFSTATPLRIGFDSYKTILLLQSYTPNYEDEPFEYSIDDQLLAKNLSDIQNKYSNLTLSKKIVDNRCLTLVDLDEISKEFRETDLFEKKFKITMCPISIDPKKDYDWENGFRFIPTSATSIEQKIESAFLEARKQKSSVILFPELSMPLKSLSKFMRMAGELDLVLITGVEYVSDSKKNSRNGTVICIPTKKLLHPSGQNYIAFLQFKNFPAAEEKYWLEKSKYKYDAGLGLFVFKSNKWADFTVLTCSDYLSLTLRWMIQGEVQTVFVPSQNIDSPTYHHISETCLRDLHALSVVCNNSQLGSSFCYAPFYKKHERTIFMIEGKSKPEFHTFSISPSDFRDVQQKADSQFPFRKPEGVDDKSWKKEQKSKNDFSKFKQLPPDWKYW